jgi:hypothetical protein
VLASDDDVDGSSIRVQMIPRSYWDEDPHFLDTFTAATREGIRIQFGELSFSSSTTYVSMLQYDTQGKERHTFTVTGAFRADGPVRAVGIVEAPTHSSHET